MGLSLFHVIRECGLFPRGFWRTPPAIHKTITMVCPLHQDLHMSPWQDQRRLSFGGNLFRNRALFLSKDNQYWVVETQELNMKKILNSKSLCNAHNGTSRDRRDDGPLLLQIGKGNRPSGHQNHSSPWGCCPWPIPSLPSSLGWLAPLLSCPRPVASHLSTAAHDFSRLCEMIQDWPGHGVLLE
jgi:hypothetical protein